MKKLVIYILGMVIGICLSVACSGKKDVATETSGVIPLTTDSVKWADTVVERRCLATINLSVSWPLSANRVTLDSLRYWIAWQLFTRYDERQEEVPSWDSLANGMRITALAGEEMADVCKSDFKSFASMDMRDNITYEFDYQIHPVFQTDSIVTYNSTRYSYLGGAHGSTVSLCQTFCLRDGEGLSIDNIFIPQSLPQILGMIKNELVKQYFTDYEDSDSVLDELLLVPESAMEFPQCPPYFMANGVAFMYQQYEIAAYCFGQPMCIIPYEALDSCFTPLAKSLIPRQVSPLPTNHDTQNKINTL